MAQDASFRRYFRIHEQAQSYILMDAPPDREKIEPFIQIAKHLLSLELRAPIILRKDIGNGFLLLEDFGDKTFTKLLLQDVDETALYNLAVDTLITLHKNPEAANINAPDYSPDLLINEALLLCDWYYPQHCRSQIDNSARDNYTKCWQSILDSLPSIQNTLVLRDYHVDNLIQLKDGQCGLLDFQDAVIGSAAYDLVSLLEDARRDVNTDLTANLLGRYFRQFNDLRQDDFLHWYSVLGAQRHCKVLGIFSRLSKRDNKHHYLDHIPRVEALLRSHLDDNNLKPLKDWLTQHSLLS